MAILQRTGKCACVTLENGQAEPLGECLISVGASRLANVDNSLGHAQDPVEIRNTEERGSQGEPAIWERTAGSDDRKRIVPSAAEAQSRSSLVPS